MFFGRWNECGSLLPQYLCLLRPTLGMVTRLASICERPKACPFSDFSFFQKNEFSGQGHAKHTVQVSRICCYMLVGGVGC